jgi:hypothetical protein
MQYQEILWEEITTQLDYFHFIQDGLMNLPTYSEWLSEQNNYN